MAYTTHPNQLDTRRGLRAGLIGLAGLAVAGVAVLGYSVATYDSAPAPVSVDFPTQDEMRAENMEIREATGAGVAGAAAAPNAVQVPTVDEMRAERWQVEVSTGPKQHRVSGPLLVPADTSEGPVQRPTRNLP